jgi:hypothetical protein
VVQKNKEGLCCSSRRLIGHQGVFARLQASGAEVVQEPTERGGLDTGGSSDPQDPHRVNRHEVVPECGGC